MQPAPGTIRTAPRRPPIFTLLAILQFVVSLCHVGVGLAILSAFRAMPAQARVRDLVVAAVAGLVFLGLGALQAACAGDLWRLKRRGYVLLRVISYIWLVAFPIGTAVAIATLIYLKTPGVELLFSERPVAELTPHEYAQLTASATSFGATVAAAGGAIFLAGIGGFAILLAIAAPWRSAPRSHANETAAIATLREFAAAESAYATAAGGAYGGPDCLVQPRECLPGYDGGPLMADVGRTFQRHSYLFMFFPPDASSLKVNDGRITAAGAMTRYAVVGIPVGPGRDGRRILCIDATSRVRWVDGDKRNIPGDLPGRCPSEWREMEP